MGRRGLQNGLKIDYIIVEQSLAQKSFYWLVKLTYALYFILAVKFCPESCMLDKYTLYRDLPQF